MAKGNVKKGFASYLLVLFIAIIAAFLIIVTVMFFSPSKNVLGFKYFKYDDKKVLVHPTGAGEDETFDFRNVENIDINCNYSNVKIERVKNKVNFGGFELRNVCSGFAREDQETDVFFEAKFLDSAKKHISVTVREPEGFLFFAKNITVSILLSTDIVESLENTSVNINTTYGNIYVGNVTLPQVADSQTTLIKIASLSAKCTSGRFVMLDNVVSVNDLFIKTTNGNIETKQPLNVNNIEVYSSSGKISLKDIYANNAVFNLSNSQFYAEKLNVRLMAKLSLKSGYFDIDNFKGTLSSNEMVNDMDSARIKIKDVDGVISLPNVNESSVNIMKASLDSQIYVGGTSSKINIQNCAGAVWVETSSGNVDLATTNAFASVKTKSGDINLSYMPSQTEGLEIVSSSGEVHLKVPVSLKFILEAYGTNGNMRTKGVTVETFDKDITLPLVINQGTQIIKIVTNENVSVNFE